jgi:phage terminase large subunit-like protein
MWDFSCPDCWSRCRLAGRWCPTCRSHGEAGRAIAIFNKLRLPDVSDRPALAEAAGEWQRDIVKAVFGSLHAENRRRIPEVFALVPQKNSKTMGGAAMMVTELPMSTARGGCWHVSNVKNLTDRVFL